LESSTFAKISPTAWVVAGRVAAVLPPRHKPTTTALKHAVARAPESVIDCSGTNERQSVLLVDGGWYFLSPWGIGRLKPRLENSAVLARGFLSVGNDVWISSEDVVAVLGWNHSSVTSLVVKARNRSQETVILATGKRARKCLIVLEKGRYVVSPYKPETMVEKICSLSEETTGAPANP